VADRQTADEGFHEIQLSGKQIVFLFMATTVVSVVIFLCGVLVGRGVQIQRAAETEHAASDPTAAAPAGAPAEAAAEPGAEALTYPQRLEGDQPVAEQLAPPAAPQPAPPAEPAAAVPADEGWVLQITALRDRDAAEALVKRLRSNGLHAIEGPLHVDDTFFDGDPLITYLSDDEGKVYSINTGALSFNFNTLEIRARPGPRLGDPVVVEMVPETRYVTVLNEGRTGGRISRLEAELERVRKDVAGLLDERQGKKWDEWIGRIRTQWIPPMPPERGTTPR